jgi:uncharacterized protein (DUF1015 family)
MASIAPFTPFRYNPDLVPDLGAVIAPPYDVISPEKRADLLRRDSRNVVRLILPEGADDARYDQAAELFREWIASGVLTRDARRGLWLYTQSFDHPDSGERVDRHGFITLLHLEPFSAGIVLPHERTLSGPKADRLKLMEATAANLEPIFGVYPDGDGRSGERIARLTEEIEPLVVATDADGVEHRLWHLTAEVPIEELVADLAGQPVFIVDGHHRYETALNYQAARRQESAEPAPYDSIMIFLAPMSDSGLVILPTHRVIHSLAGFDIETLLDSLSESFELVDLDSPDAALIELASRPEIPTLLLASHGRLIVARLRPEVDTEQLLGTGVSAALRGLDVTILHEYILERLLGISKEAQAGQRNLLYVKSTDEALDAAEREDVQLVVLMNPTRLDQVEAVALSGEVMPQKSTFFYPKLASGLLFNPLW